MIDDFQTAPESVSSPARGLAPPEQRAAFILGEEHRLVLALIMRSQLGVRRLLAEAEQQD